MKHARNILLVTAIAIALGATSGRAGTVNATDARTTRFVNSPALDSGLTRIQSVNVTVNTVSFAFAPQVIVVPAGTTVVWQDPSFNGVNDICHTVTSASSLTSAAGGVHDTNPNDPDSFDAPVCNSLGANSFVHTFTTPGIHYYFCRPHAQFGMIGAVVVAP